MSIHPVLIDGQWRESQALETFQAENPRTQQPLADQFPVSSWQDCQQALDAATRAADVMRQLRGEQLARFLERYAERIEQHRTRDQPHDRSRRTDDPDTLVQPECINGRRKKHRSRHPS